jgi:SSS family solute:Na+ symporter
VPLFLFAIPGALAYALLPNLANGDQVFPTLIVKFLPAGLTGLVIAGIIAAIMSTIDSTLNAASTLVMYDFVRADQRGWSPHHILWLGRLTTLVFIIVAALWPLVIRDFPGLFSYIQQVFSYAVPPVAAVFLLALFWPRMTGAAAIATLVLGHVLGATLLAWKIWTQANAIPDRLPHFTIVAGLTTLFCLAVGTVASWLTPAPSSAHVTGMLWSRGDDAAPPRGLSDFRWQGAAIVVVVGALIWTFR